MAGLQDRFETTDGSRPEAVPLSEDAARAHRLPAFTLLDGGDVFDAQGRKPDVTGLDEAARWAEERLEIVDHAGGGDFAARVQGDAVRQLAGNPALAARMRAARPVVVDVVSGVKEMIRLGYPRAVSRNASGLFWDHPSWERARIALRADRLGLPEETALVFHELGHAIHYLAFTKPERDLIYRVLRPTFGSRSAMDEVFAIYTERELLGPRGFSELEKRAPGIYGFARRKWEEGQLFAAFIRKLYFPARKVAGDKGQSGHQQWKKFMGG